MKIRFLLTISLVMLMLAHVGYGGRILAADDTAIPKEQKIDVDIGFNQEDRDVGLKRMEIIDKALSPELLEKKRALVHAIEQDYEAKISRLLQRLTTPIGTNTVIAHLDVNFFDTEFESQVRASQNASVSVILGRDGFDKWANNMSSQEDALSQIKQMIQATFKIPAEGISITVAPN